MIKPGNYFVYLVVVLLIVSGLLLFAVFISNPARAAGIDRSILYSTDDIFHYAYVKTAFYDPLAILNPSAKLLYTMIGMLFLWAIPFGMLSLRIMNVFFSAGIIILLCRIMQKMGIDKKYIMLAVIMTVSFPLFLIASVSTLTEIMFSFFLICGIYLFCSERYLFSAFFISFLPVIRQEGILFILIWMFLLPKRGKYGSIALLFAPISLWVSLNYLVAGKSTIDHTFFYFLKLTSKPPEISTNDISQVKIFLHILYHPLSVLAFLGIIIKFRDKKYKIFLLCLASYIALLGAWKAAHILIYHCISRELRFIIPMVPILSIYAAIPAQKFIENLTKRKFMQHLALMILAVVFLTCIPYGLYRLQDDPRVREDGLTQKQEEDLREASQWLNSYIVENNIVNVCYPGEIFTHKVIRRLWMYAPGRIFFYPILNNQTDPVRVLNLVTFNTESLGKKRSLFIDLQSIKDISANPNFSYLRNFPDIPLYSYRINDEDK